VPTYPWQGMWFSSPWGNAGSPATSDFTVTSNVIGQNDVQFAFLFKSDSLTNFSYAGWAIQGVKIYFIP
jgi:hypothetical protein